MATERQLSRGCIGKRWYPSKSKANGIVRVMRQKGLGDSRLNAYKCPACHRWHVGNRGKGTS